MASSVDAPMDGSSSSAGPSGVVGQDEQQLDIVEASATTYTKIETLQDSGINVADVAKLKAAGYATINSIVSVMRKDLVAVKGLGEAKVDKIIEAAYKSMGAMCAAQGAQSSGHGGNGSGFFETAEQALVKLETVRFKITSGASSLDEILRGGIETGCITELYGEFRCGKTQLCHTLAVQAQLHETFPGKCMYIDTEGTFRADRIQEICAAHNVDPEEVMGNIVTARAMTSEHLNALLKEACTMMVDESSGQFGILIIDSIMGIFRQDFSGRGELAERQQLLGKTLNRLAKMAHEFNIAVVLTNQVMADPSGGVGATFNALPKPIGGHVLAHASTVRLMFRKGKGDERVVKIVDSPNLPEQECTIQIYAGGVRSPEGMA
mmetsp:Transcript_25867/g.65205  ORF Transcript_25867/g.65205 Transcript_25867/m.65205 type:complete len:379 (-) Transcript_25867:957-2093(-)|eukprot:CAMPEP_0178990794 /NCGR_PEP_ID=MMETSP0795-20121207/5165_1 /TAXON_ID=88552 /ORGANISM="Amoebophrya sp., Strain Ameob2" /LENGTH=378 /DNA_ID=CAMNT_0020682421 /DNA_START=339 /DNA_END=1475 /DNA_ORIENTATION=-